MAETRRKFDQDFKEGDRAERRSFAAVVDDLVAGVGAPII